MGPIWLDCRFFFFSFFVVGGFNQIYIYEFFANRKNKKRKRKLDILKGDLNFQRWGQIKGFGGTKAKNSVLQW